MSQDSSESQAGTPQTLVILKPKSDSLKAAENFLKNRNWSLISSPNLREALAGIIQKQPRFVLLAADHPNKKVKMLPKLLAQAFPCRVIAFAESSNNASMAALHEMGMEYTLYPPISGPAIERMINKIIKDDETRKNNPEQNRLTSTATGTSSDTNNSTLVTSSGTNTALEQARAALSQLMSNPESETDANINPEGTATPHSPHSPAYMPDHSHEKSSNTGPGVIIQKGTAGQSFQTSQSETNPTPDLLSTDFSSDWTKPEIDPSDSLHGVGGSVWQKKKTDDATKSALQLDKKEFLTGTYEQNENESIIQKATESALEEVTAQKNSETIEQLEKASNVACIIIESAKFNGYLIAALGKNKVIDDQFMTTIQEKLYSFLKAHGDLPSNESKIPLKLKIQEIEFENWALEQAQFLKKTIHGSDEIAMAFFPTQETKIQLEDSASEHMAKMKVSELREGIILEFDLYIYMPENQKFLLYTPQGWPLHKDQKDRLLEKGVHHMHLRKENMNAVVRYHAQNFLNDKIQNYQGRKST